MFSQKQKELGELSLIEIVNKFCRENEAGLNIFGKFSQKDIPQHFVLKTSVATQTFFVFLFLTVSLTKYHI